MTNTNRASELVSRWEHGDEKHRQWLRDIATPDITTALDTARRDALEEAAQTITHMCDTRPSDWGNHHPFLRSGYATGCSEAILAIRALIPTPAPEVTKGND